MKSHIYRVPGASKVKSHFQPLFRKDNIFSNEEIGKFLVKKKKMRLRITLTWCVSISVDSADTMSAYTQLVHDTKRNSENQKLIHVVL